MTLDSKEFYKDGPEELTIVFGGSNLLSEKD